MIETKQFYYKNGSIYICYKCDKCGKICTEMHPEENYYLFVCRNCKMRYILNKRLGCVDYEIGGD